uniref:ANK_REP_REGION domain-containing protein n=1 Tax=Macrostomum lignano TaxID=282301 RepID=A0A1I8GXM6_9PLAT
MEELKPMLMELGSMFAALQSMQAGEGLPRQFVEQMERRSRELNLPDNPQELKARMKEEQRKMKANFKKLKAAAQKGSSETDSSSESSDSEDETEVNAEIGAFLGAAALGNVGFCSMMLQKGVDVNARGQKSTTALHAATHEDKSDVVNLLLSRGADVNAADSDGDTPLMLAIMKKHRPLIRLLVERGTNLQWRNKKGFTAADLAFIAEDRESLDLIQERERSLQFDCKVHNESILSFAQKGSTKMIEYWLTNYPQTDDVKPCDLQYKDGRTIAFTAALNGSEELLVLVDSLDADLDLPDNSNSSPLFCAAQNGYDSIVRMLIDKGCDVNRVRDTGRTALFSAIVNSHLNIVKILVEEGANFNIKDKTGTCPLACSIVCGSQEIFDYLLDEKEADCSVIDESGNDLVLIAALYKRFQMLRQLHERGLPLDAVNNKDGETALLSACQVRCPEMVEYLADRGAIASFNNDLATVKVLAKRKAQLDVPNKRGETAILVSAQKKSLPLVEYLYKKHCDINVIDKNGHTLAYYAATTDNMEMLHALIRYSAPLDCQDKKGNTPLMIAAMKPANLKMLQILRLETMLETQPAVSLRKQGSLDVLQYLDSIGEELVNITKKGKTIIMQASKRNQLAVLRLIKASEKAMSDLEATCDLGRTAVHYAAVGGHTEAVDFLSNEMHAETDAKDFQGNTPFMLAVQKKHKEVAEKLYDLGADVNIRNNGGENAAHLAVQAESLELLRFLDQKGCFLDQEDKSGKTPLMLACEKKKMALINFLLARNCFPKSFSKDGRQVIHVACESGKAHIAKRFIDLGVPVHAADSSGISTLMLAAQSGSSEIIEALITRKQQLVEMKDIFGKSALEYAIVWDQEKVINQLIDAGCNVDNQQKDGRTPLMLAIASTSKSADEVVQTLIEHGCSVDAVTEDGFNAAHVACKYNKLQVLKVLMEKGVSIESLTKSSDSCLTLAVPKGSAELIGLLVDAGLSKSHINCEGHSAVSLGYQRGNEEVLSKLLPVSDSDVSNKYANGNTLLHLACEGGLKKLIESLLDRDPTLLEAKNSKLETPVHVASRCSKLELVDLLLQRGADINSADEMGETPLFMAISAGNFTICKSILDKKPDLSLLNSEGVSAMAKAYHKGKTSIIRLLQAEEAPLFPEKLPASFEVFRTNLLQMKFKNLNELLNAGLSIDRLEKDWHLLHLGIETSRSELITELLNRGASVNCERRTRQHAAPKRCHFRQKNDVNNKGDTVLHIAAKKNKLSTLSWLLTSFDFEKNVRNKQGQTALHIAASKGNVKMYELLVQKGFDSALILEEEQKKYRVSHISAMSNSMSLLRHLRAKGELSIQFSKKTPSVFEILAFQGQLKVLQQLCNETGQNYEDENFFGARNMAFFTGHEAMCTWMINVRVDLDRPDRDGETPISRSVVGGNFHLCRELIEKVKCDLSVKTKHGVSLVQKAVVANHEPILRYLIQRNASIEEADNDGDTPLLEAQNLPAELFDASDLHCDTPLMLSVLHEKTDAFSYLLENFALDVNHQNETKSSALHWAAQKSNLTAVRGLLSNNAAVDLLDKDGVTPLMLAVKAKSTECAKALLDSGASLTAKNRYGDSALALMLHSDDGKMKDLGRELHGGSHMDVTNRNRRQSSVHFEDLDDSQEIAAAFTAHRSISMGSFVLKIEAQSSDRKWQKLIDDAMVQSFKFPKSDSSESEAANLCQVADIKYGLEPRPTLELSISLPKRRLSECLDRIRDRDQIHHCLDRDITHGRLTLASIFVTDNHVLKLSDYGMLSQLAAYVANSHRRYDPWTAPELRRVSSEDPKLATQA